MKTPSQSQSTFAWWALCIGLFFISLSLSFIVGPASIDWSELIWQYLPSVHAHSQDLENSRQILWDIRLPRIITAMLAGGSMAVAGVISQTLFQNPLAGPSVIGTASGGVFAAVLVLAMGVPYFLAPSLAAFAGAMITTLFILILCRTRFGRRIDTILLTGFALNALWGAVTSLVMSLKADDWQRGPSLWDWVLGSFTGRSWEHVSMGLPFVVIGILFAFSLTRRLNLLALGQEVASSLSLNVKRLEFMSIIVMCLLVAGAVTMSGALPFVGLIVPHLTRLMVGSTTQRMMPLAFLNGMTLVVMADWLARIVAAPNELPAGILISLLGAPFFLWLLFQQATRGERGSP